MFISTIKQIKAHWKTAQMKHWKGTDMDKRKTGIFLLIFLLGLISGFTLSSAVRGHGIADTSAAHDASEAHDVSETHNVSEAHNASETHNVSGSPVPQALVTSGCSYPEWDKHTTYTGGDKAVYSGKIYKARWWTLGEIPGQADVWEYTPEMPAQPEAVRKASTSPAKIVGYYPSWKSYQPQKLQMDVLTHIAYAFAIPTSDGRLLPLENPETAIRLIEYAHKNQVKVLLAVGGWSHNGTELEPVFVNATSTSEKTRQLGDEILAMCSQYGFDGVDMDWEHPRMDGSSKDQYQELILYLADTLHAQDKLLTSAVISGVSADGNICYDAAAHSDAVLEAVDWIHVMAYDGGDGERHSSYEFAVNCAAYWCGARKMPADKVVLGVPFYSRPGWAGYEDILAADPDAWSKDHALVNGADAFYNGISTMEKKAVYARENLGGIMIWELTQDTDNSDKSLLSAIKRGMQ